MTSSVIIPIIFITVYFLALIWGAFFTKGGKMKNKGSIEEFAVGDRSFGWIVVLCCLMGLLFTSSGLTSWFSWTVGEGMFPQYLTIYASLGFLFTFIFAKRIWIWGKHYNLLTQPDYIYLRYKSRPLSNLVAVCAVLIEAPWIIMEFAAMGYMINAVTGLPTKIGMVIIVVLIMAYILYSGMKSLAVTELIQGFLVIFIMFGGAVFLTFKLFGGWGHMMESVMEVASDNLTINLGGTYTYEYWSSTIIVAALGIMGWASFFTRIYTAKSVKEVKKVSWWSVLVVAIVNGALMIFAVGCITVPEAVEAIVNENSLFILTNMVGGPVFTGLFAIVVLAAGMSLISVVINSHSIIISENFIKPYKKNLSSESRVKIARWTIVIYSVIALVIALVDLPNLYFIAMAVYNMIAQIVPMVVLSIYWKRSNRWGAGLGLICGLGITLSGSFIDFTFFGWSPAILGLLINIIVHIACGFIFKKDDGVDEMFDVLKKYKVPKIVK